MKNSVFYIPAILHIVLVCFVMLLGIGSILPGVYAWIALFLVSGFLLDKGRFWGGFWGMIPGINLIYMSTKDTGQISNIELPGGIIILVFYILCSGFVFYKEKKVIN